MCCRFAIGRLRFSINWSASLLKTTIYSRSSEFLWAIFVLFNFRLQDNANNFNNNNNNIHNKMVNYRTISNSLLDDRVRRPTHHRPLLIKTLPNMYWSPPRQHWEILLVDIAYWKCIHNVLLSIFVPRKLSLISISWLWDVRSDENKWFKRY